jgi:transketolase
MNNQKNYEILTFKKKLLKNILDMAYNAGSRSAHIGGALSLVDIISVLFSKFININDIDKSQKNKDKFILSKGHACLAYYSALNIVGLISSEKLKTFEKDDTDLPGHPVRNPDLGIEFSNGSLGMGLSIGIGLSLGYKKKKISNSVYVILGDGECNEGSVWEAAMAAPNYRLDNLIAIIDNNNFQQTGTNSQIMSLGNLNEKWKSFGWEVFEFDGHSIQSILRVLENLKKNNIPKLLIAKTIKGKGFDFAENNNDWHHSILTKEKYLACLKQIEKII